MAVQRIDSRLYHLLLEEGGFSLVAVYSTLKRKRNAIHSYQPEDDISGYNLLKRCTGISISILRKYVPILVRLNLADFLSGGGFFLTGNNKNKSKNNKLVPIQIFDKYTDTKTACEYVIIHSNILKQKKKICKKVTQRELLNASQSQKLKSKKEYQAVKRLNRNGIFKVSDLKIVENTTLSNKSFMFLLSGCRYENSSTGKSKKDKMKSLGLIEIKRNFKTLSYKTTYSEFLNYKKYVDSSPYIIFKFGYICRELSNSVTCIK